MALAKIFTDKKKTPGFTLIEILVVIGLFTIVGSLALIVSMDDYRGFSTRNERDTLISILQRARSQSINNMCFGAFCTDGKSHGVHITSDSYTIFQGVSFAARDMDVDEVITIEDKGITLSGFTDVVFNALSGDATTAPLEVWSLALIDSSGRVSTITVNSKGRITWTP